MIKLKHGNYKDCSLRIPLASASSIAKLTFDSQIYYFHCTRGDNLYEIPAILARSLNIPDNALAFYEQVSGKPCKRVEVEPADEDSWEILSFNADFIELNLLMQIKVVQKGITLPLWVHNCCVWLKVVDLESEWGVLQMESEIAVKPKIRKKAKSSVKELRAMDGDLWMRNSEFPDNAILACASQGLVTLGISKSEAVPASHISSSLLEKFVKYKVVQILQVQVNTICCLNKYTMEVRAIKGEFIADCSEEDFESLIKIYGKILIFEGMKFEANGKSVSIALKAQVNKSEWVGFMLTNSTSKLQYLDTAALKPRPALLLQIPTFLKFSHKLTSDLQNNQVLILQGSQGVGKSSLLSLFTQSLETQQIASVRISCRNVPRKDFVNKIAEVMELREKMEPCWVVIEDLESFCGKIDDNQGDEAKLASNQCSILLLSVLEANRSTKFIISCKHVSNLNSLISTSAYRFAAVQCPALTRADINFIISSFFPSSSLTDLSSQIKSFSLSDIINFCKLAVLQLHSAPASYDSLQPLLLSFTPQALDQPIKPTAISISDIGGMFSAKRRIIESFGFATKYSSLYSSYPLKIRSGMLLFGPPGCGKTLLASIIPSICELSMLSVKGPELLNKYIGASEQAVREVFERAKRVRPSAIVFDEFEAIVPRRGSGSTAVTDRIVNQFLCELDGVEARDSVFVIGVSSRPELIDPALLRPGRLDFHIYCAFPSIEEIADILRIMCGKLGINADFERVAERCQGFTPADLQGLMNNLQIKIANYEGIAVSEEDLLEELKGFKKSFSEKQIEEYKERYSRFINKAPVEVGKKVTLYD